MDATDPYNPVANGLVSLYNRAIGSGRRKTDLMSRIQEVAKLSAEKLGQMPSEKHLDWIAEATKDLMDGKSINKVFGKEPSKKGGRKISPADMYVTRASRKGGRDLAAITADPNKSVKHLLDSFTIRGVQWGNSVTDDERVRSDLKRFVTRYWCRDDQRLEPFRTGRAVRCQQRTRA